MTIKSIKAAFVILFLGLSTFVMLADNDKPEKPSPEELEELEEFFGDQFDPDNRGDYIDPPMVVMSSLTSEYSFIGIE